MTIVEPLSALFVMIVSWMISFFGVCVSLYVRLSLGFSGICNGMCTSSLIEVFHCLLFLCLCCDGMFCEDLLFLLL